MLCKCFEKVCEGGSAGKEKASFCLCARAVPGFRCFSSSESCFVLLYLLLLMRQNHRLLTRKQRRQAGLSGSLPHFPFTSHMFFNGVAYNYWERKKCLRIQLIFVLLLRDFPQLRFFEGFAATEGNDNENRERRAAGKLRTTRWKHFRQTGEEGGMPQVARDKRCFLLNKETVKTTFVSEQVRMCVAVGTCACVWVRTPAEADTQAEDINDKSGTKGLPVSLFCSPLNSCR